MTPEPVRFVSKALDNMGHRRVALKSDIEPAIKALAGRVKHLRSHLTGAEASPEYEPQSNGLTERCVQKRAFPDVQERAREWARRRCARRPHDTDMVDTDMVDTSCRLLAHQVSCRACWRTPWARVVGKRSGAAVAEFGERVMYMARGPNRDRRWSFGVWQGLVMRTREAYLGTPEGVVRAWTVKRLAEQERWKVEDVKAARGTTQRPDPNREGEEVHIHIPGERPPEATPAPPPALHRPCAASAS